MQWMLFSGTCSLLLSPPTVWKEGCSFHYDTEQSLATQKRYTRLSSLTQNSLHRDNSSTWSWVYAQILSRAIFQLIRSWKFVVQGMAVPSRAEGATASLSWQIFHEKKFFFYLSTIIFGYAFVVGENNSCFSSCHLFTLYYAQST